MQYALKITQTNLPLLTMLNGGVEPQIEEIPTYLVITIDGPDSSHNDIVTEREFWHMGEIDLDGPLLFTLKK